MSNEQPLSCPFCGGDSAIGTLTIRRWKDMRGRYGEYTGYAVNCIVCGTNNRGIAEGYKTEAQAVAHWNRRVTQREAV